MDESELHTFREGWKNEIKTRQGDPALEKDKTWKYQFGKHVDIDCKTTETSKTTQDFPYIFDPKHHEKHRENQFLVSKKQKQSVPLSLLTLDIPSYQRDDFENKNKDTLPDTTLSVAQRTSRTEPDFISLLIRDIDEITTVAFFDISLPKEVCVKIFGHLDVMDLCHCACVSKAWSTLANDELIWHNIYKQLGFRQILGGKVLEQTDWKGRAKDSILRQQLTERNWKEMICQTQTLEYEKGVALSACEMYQNLLIAGYANGKTCLWDVESNWRHSLEPSSEVLEDPAKASAECVSRVGDICATGFICGMINVWHTDISVHPIYQYRLPKPADHVILASTNTNPFLLTSNGSDIRIDQVLDDDGQWGIVNSKSFENQITMVNLLPDNNEVRFAIAMKEDVVIYKPTTHSLADLDKISGTKITAMTSSEEYIAVGWVPFGFGTEFTTKVRLYDSKTGRHLETFVGHYGDITCLNLSFREGLVTGSKDKRVRVYDIRTERPQLCLRGQSSSITTVQMDSWKVVSGSFNGTVKVWDIRMGTALWETRSTHPVRVCQFDGNRLVTANIPLDKVPRESMWYADDLILHRRHRGSVKVHDFGGSCESGVVPEEMRSSYDNTAGYNYNINLVAPYDLLDSEIN